MAAKSKFWFDGSPESLPSVVKKFENRLSTERFLDAGVSRLYWGQSLLGAGTTAGTSDNTMMKASAYLRVFDGRTSENLIKPVLDACASMVVRKPAIKVITSGASWKKDRSARLMSRLLTGLFEASGFNASVTPVFLDSCRNIVAGVRWDIDPDTGKVTAARVLPHQISFNPAEGANPRHLYLRHGISRDVLAKRYPDQAAEIEKLAAYKPDPAFDLDQTYSDEDQVEVCEGWRLPRGKSKGRFVMTAGAIVLEDAEWKIPVFPVCVLTFGDSYSSLAGDPLARQILPFQLKLNRYNRTIEENAAKCANPKIAIPFGAEVEQITSVMAEIVRYNAAGGEVHWLPGQMMPSQFYAEKAETKTAAYAAGGVSQSVASATKAPGLNSGRAQREAYDQASGRLVLHAEKLERWFGDNASVVLALMRAAYGKKSQRIKAPNTRLLEEIDWSAVADLKEDEVEVRCYITSSIPNEPAGRAETLAERVEAQVMSQRRANRWYADPDNARLEDEDSAAEDLARKMVESCVDDGKYIAPETVMGAEGLQMLLDIAGTALMQALCMPEPPPADHLELLRRLIEEARLMLQPEPAQPANDNGAPQEAAQPDQAAALQPAA